jgi:proline racemase
MRLIQTIDSHTAGEGTRLVTGGLPPLRGYTLAEKLAYARQSLPDIPGMLLCEPHGHNDLYGAILTSPCQPDADIGLVFMNNQGYEPMCGHAIIGAVTSLLETGVFPRRPPKTTLRIDTAAGVIECHASTDGERVTSVAFDNVPCFAYQLDAPLPLPEFPELAVDIAFGGNFFVLVEANQVGVSITPANLPQLIELGMHVLASANDRIPVCHPLLPWIDRILDVRFYQASESPGVHSRNLVVLGDRMVDRSPCGTGTCAELAVRFARRQLSVGELYVTEGILGTRFTGKVIAQVEENLSDLPYPAILPRVEGQAYLTGLHQLIFQADDPFPQGFVLKE